MRLIDADELIEHAWRDKVDSRELIVQMINNAPTIKEIPTKIPINVFEQLLSQEPKTGHWVDSSNGWMCSECNRDNMYDTNYCPNCGCRMVEPQERSDKE